VKIDNDKISDKILRILLNYVRIESPWA